MLDGDVPHLYFIAQAFNGTRNALGENLLRNNLSGADAARRPPLDCGRALLVSTFFALHSLHPLLPLPFGFIILFFLFPSDDEFYDYDVAIIA